MLSLSTCVCVVVKVRRSVGLCSSFLQFQLYSFYCNCQVVFCNFSRFFENSFLQLLLFLLQLLCLPCYRLRFPRFARKSIVCPFPGVRKLWTRAKYTQGTRGGRTSARPATVTPFRTREKKKGANHGTARHRVGKSAGCGYRCGTWRGDRTAPAFIAESGFAKITWRKIANPIDNYKLICIMRIANRFER